MNTQPANGEETCQRVMPEISISAIYLMAETLIRGGSWVLAGLQDLPVRSTGGQGSRGPVLVQEVVY